MEHKTEYEYCDELRNVRGGLYKRHYGNHRLEYAWFIATTSDDYFALLSIARAFQLLIEARSFKGKNHFALRLLVPDDKLAGVT